jgi:pSer/pThr/pTyr-binding forkhead associated (FHA) protein
MGHRSSIEDYAMAGDPVESSLWCRGTLVVGVEGLGQRKHVTFAQPFVRCGSLDTCDLTLRGPGIPRRLLYLHATTHGIFAVPLVAPGRFAPLPSGWLLPKISLHVGPFRISWQWDCDSEAGQVSPSDPSHLTSLVEKGSLKRRWELDIFVDGHRVGRYELSRVLTLVGRHSPSHLNVTSRSVSSCHCVIVAEEDRLWFVDLCSGNGTRLEKQPITAGEWPIGVALQLGRVTLVARPTCSQSYEMHRAGLSQQVFDDHKPVDSVTSGSQSESQPRDDQRDLSTLAHDPILGRTENQLTDSRPHVNTPNSKTEYVEESEPEIPTFFIPPSYARIRAFDSDVLESLCAPEAEPSPEQSNTQSTTVVDSDKDEADGESKTATEEPSFLGRYDSLVVHQEFVQPGGRPELIGTEIIVEEDMQDNSLSAQAKDYVLRLFADESCDGQPGSLATEDFEELQGPATFPETPEQTPDYIFAGRTTIHPQSLISDSLEKKTQELIIKEQLLAAWAKTLDKMSEAILRLQEELVAEEDRFAEQQQSLAERERQLAAWHDELECRADKLSRGEQELLRVQREIAEKERAIEERHQFLLGESRSLAEENHRLQLLRKECDDREEKLSALQRLLSERERDIQHKQDAIAEQEASLKQWADRLAEEESKLRATEHELERRGNTLASREQELALRERELQEKSRQLGDWEASLDELRQTLLRHERDLKQRFDELTCREQHLIDQQQVLENTRQGLTEREQSLALQTRELTLRIQQLGEKERRIADQIKELEDWQVRLQRWEEELRLRESSLAAAETSTSEKDTAVVLAATRNEGDLKISPRAECEVSHNIEPETSTFGEEPVVSMTTATANTPVETQTASNVTARSVSKARAVGEWYVIPLAKVRRRWRVSAPFAVGLSTVLLVACLAWWIFPRQFMTVCRIEFPETSPLLYVRDGTWPTEASKDLFPQLTPVAPDSADVVERLKRDTELAHLSPDENIPLDQVLASVGISRSEGLPFTTLSLTSPHPEMARHVLEKWGNTYVAVLVESLQQRITPALSKAQSEWQMKSQQLSKLLQKIHDLKAQHNADNPRQIEFQARESLQMADLAEKEIEQLTAEIKIQTERLEEARVLVNNPEQAVTEEEVLSSLAERIKKEGLTLEESQPNQDTAQPSENMRDESYPNGRNPNNNSNMPQASNNSSDKSRYAMLRELVRKELIERKRQDAVLTAQVLEAELQRLQSRLQMTRDRKSKYEATGQSLQEAAGELSRLETEAVSLQRACERLKTQIETLETALAQSKIWPQTEVWCTQQRPWIPIAFAALAGGITVVPFGLWWVIRSRRIMTLLPPSAFEREAKYPQSETE